MTAIEKIQGEIDNQQSYLDELYYSNQGEEYDLGFIEGLKHALNIVKKEPKEPARVIIKEIPTNKILIHKIYMKRYVFRNGNDIIYKMIKLCQSYDNILTDEIMRKYFHIDMDILRENFNSKDK